MRRTSPRPLARALAAFAEDARPATLLARVQAEWPGVAGPVTAREAEPVAESGDAIEMACTSAVWAQELELLEPDLRRRLNTALGGSDVGPISKMRFRVRGARQPRRRRRT